LILALAALSSTALAVDSRSTARPQLDFELSDGQRFITLSSLPQQLTVISFWRADCPPCLRELPDLARFARRGQARVITIALQRPSETAAAPAPVLAALQSPLLSLHGPQEPRGLLARFGNRTGALPYTVFLDSERRPCAQHSGAVEPRWLDEAMAACVAGSRPSLETNAHP
jgi:thiol-disulfide isomerase/thioredoxin